MARETPIAKITRPRLSHILARDRLATILDQGSGKAVTWVAAPGGSGKTTAVAQYADSRGLPCIWFQLDQGDNDLASFFYYLGLAAKKANPRRRDSLPHLTPEYLLGIPVFTRRFFEQFFRRFNSPAFLVFDDYQEVGNGDGFHEMMANALEVVPPGIRVMVLSRSEPPPQLARLRANNCIHHLGWEDIRFTEEETRDLVALTASSFSPVPTESLHKITAGWVAGMVLLLARATAGGAGLRLLDHPAATREVFDYFASEIFSKTDDATQELLLRTSFLQRIEPATAAELTGNRQAGQILDRLSRHHFFTELYGTAYRYHPLFREFLLNRAMNRYTEREIAGIQRQAALFLEGQGLAEEATTLCIEAGEWQEAARLILGQAHNLTAQGRSRTLEGWIHSFPPQMLAGNPWLIYWLGACRLPFDPRGGLDHFRHAFDLFQEQSDLPWALRAWSAAVNAVFVEWNDFRPFDGLIDWYYNQPVGVAFPSPEIEAEFSSMMLCAMVFRHSSHPDVGKWAERALEVSRTCGNPRLRHLACTMAYGYFMWIGDVERELSLRQEVQAMSRSLQVPPLIQLTCRWLNALTLFRVAGSPEEGLGAVAESITLSRDHGIHAWDNVIFGLGAYGSILKADQTAAAGFLDQVHSVLRPECSNGYCQYHALVAWYHTVFGDAAAALNHGELALKLALEVAPDSYPVLFCRIILTNILCDSKQYRRAEQQLALAGDLIAVMPSAILEFMLHLASAYLYLEQGKDQAGIAALRRGMGLGRSRNYVAMYFWWQPKVMSRLCARALHEGIVPDYVRRLVRRNRLRPDEESDHLDGWPWPVQIHTLGRFEVLHDDRMVDFSGKRKIPELLKVLIALGGTAIPGEQLMDLLWPDADGDDARNAFKMTLSRLRRLLPDDSIILQDGRLSLNRQLIRADVWAFEHLCNKAIALLEREGLQNSRKTDARTGHAEAIRLSEKALYLYRGAFLPGDSSQNWAVAPRERLRNRLLRLVTVAGRHREEKGRWKSAAAFYRQGLEVDRLQEEFYHRLMVCHRELGQPLQAIATYERCCAELAAGLGMSPSSRIHSLYTMLRAGE